MADEWLSLCRLSASLALLPHPVGVGRRESIRIRVRGDRALLLSAYTADPPNQPNPRSTRTCTTSSIRVGAYP